MAWRGALPRWSAPQEQNPDLVAMLPGRGAEKMKRLSVNADAQCVGCRQCEAICSAQHTGCFAPWLSRVRIHRNEAKLLFRPIICRQCRNAKCQQACLVGAIEPNAQGVLEVDAALCIGCAACVQACPFQAMVFDAEAAVASKCDLCGGDPACVKVCPANVLNQKEG